MPDRLDSDSLLSRPTPVIVHLSGGFRGLTQRLLGDRLRIGARPDAEIEVARMDLPPGSIGEDDTGYLASLARQDEGYGSFAWIRDPEGNRIELYQGLERSEPQF